MEDLNFYQLAKKKQEFENVGVGNTALDETYPIREDIPAELWGKPIVVSAAPPYGPELIEEKHDPQHYQKGNIQVWDFIADQKLDYFKGNVVKYVCRAGSKSGESELDDLMKAKVYVEKAIELLALQN